MATQARPLGHDPLGPGRAILYGTIAVGVLDLLDAVLFFGLTRGIAPIRILQSIASGLLGRASYSGGLATACLGALLHFFIAFCIVCTYYFAAQRFATLQRRPLLCGPVYGIGVYFFMNLVVLPLSAAGKPTFPLPVFLNGILIHMLGVGLPSALFARRGLGEAPQP